MFGPRVRIKICGLTRVDEALACLNAGADWIGLNFHPGSSRFIDRIQAREIVAAVADPSRVVGLFVDRPPGVVEECAGDLGIRIVQLHGHEPPEDLLRLSHLQIVRAYRLGRVGDIREMVDDLARAGLLGRSPDAVLVEAAVPGQPGERERPWPTISWTGFPPAPADPCGGALPRERRRPDRAGSALDGRRRQRRRVEPGAEAPGQGRRVHPCCEIGCR